MQHYEDIVTNSYYDQTDLLISPDVPVTPEVVARYIGKWKDQLPRYKYFKNCYYGKHPIFYDPNKPPYKPDHRVCVNFCKYITDTLNGFFLGIPLKITSPDEKASEFLSKFERINNFREVCFELSKVCSIYGHGYLMIYLDNEPEFRVAVLTPEQCCVVYDDTLSHDPVFAFTVYENADGTEQGSYCTKDKICYFDDVGRMNITESPNFFHDVSIVEFVENREKQSAYESVASLNEEINKTLSEKANSVDYFGDAYLKMLGGQIEDEDVRAIRENRLIYFDGEEAKDMVVEFLQKPDGDVTEEHLLDRLEEYLFNTAMVPNLSDESFGQASGTSLKYKLHNLTNLAQYKQIKFEAGLNNVFRIICNSAKYFGTSKDDWVDFDYKFTLNIPSNVLEESQIAQNLSGIVSQPTQLSVLSVVQDVQDEIKRLEEETPEVSDYGLMHNHESELLEE